jgi:hypothetical protein
VSSAEINGSAVAAFAHPKARADCFTRFSRAMTQQ